MGASIASENSGRLPLRFAGGRLKGISYRLPVPSAQVKSAILIAGLFANGDTSVVEDTPTRDHTETLLTSMGATVRKETGVITVVGGSRLEGTRVVVPGDMSSAAYFIVAATCLQGSDVYLPITGVNPYRTGIITVLERMGAEITLTNEHTQSAEPVADIGVRSVEALSGVTVDDPAMIASMIDEIPILAVAATQARGTTTIRGATELRRKESDRIDAIVRNLSALGVDTEEYDDGFSIHGPAQLHGAQVSSFGDHRMAMAMTVAGLLASGTTEIDDASAVQISYPDFFIDLRSIVRDGGGAK